MSTRNAIDDIVYEVMSRYQAPYPEDITDRVCIDIENNQQWFKRYENELKAKGNVINSRIGWRVKDITGLQNIARCYSPKSKLIKTYMRLG